MGREWSMPDVMATRWPSCNTPLASTGTAKGVVLNHANFGAQLALISYRSAQPFGKGRLLVADYHDMGLIGGILQPLATSAVPNILISPMSFLAEAVPLAVGDHAIPAEHQRRTQFAYDLCVRKITPEQRKTLDLSTSAVMASTPRAASLNPNSQGGEVPSLLHVADDYTKPEIAKIIRNGKTPPLADTKKNAPPLYMPSWKLMLTDEDVNRIVEYLWSLQPKKDSAW